MEGRRTSSRTLLLKLVDVLHVSDQPNAQSYGRTHQTYCKDIGAQLDAVPVLFRHLERGPRDLLDKLAVLAQLRDRSELDISRRDERINGLKKNRSVQGR